MPIYQYRCSRCGAEFDYLLKSRDEKVRCDQCSSESLERLPSVFAAVSASPAKGCAAAKSCPSAHQCGGGCGCHHGH